MDIQRLLRDVRILRQIKDKKSHMPSSGIIWSVGPYLAATNLEQVAFVKSELNLRGPVVADRLYETLLGARRGGTVSLAKDGVCIKTSLGENVIPYASDLENDLPKLPAFHTRVTPISVSNQALEYVHRAVSREVVRYVLTGVMFDNGNLVASDGKRLHYRSYKSEKGFPKIVIPSVAVKALIEMSRDGQIDQLGLSSDNKENPSQVSFSAGDYTLHTRVVEGSFPDWRSIMPETFIWEVRLESAPLRDALTQICKFLGKEKGYAVKLTLDRRNGAVILTAKSEKTERVLKVPMCGGDGDIDGLHGLLFNPSFMLEAMWNSRETVLQGHTCDKAMLVDGVGIIMPLTVSELRTADEQSFAASFRQKNEKNPGKLLPVKPEAASKRQVTITPTGDAEKRKIVSITPYQPKREIVSITPNGAKRRIVSITPRSDAMAPRRQIVSITPKEEKVRGRKTPPEPKPVVRVTRPAKPRKDTLTLTFFR